MNKIFIYAAFVLSLYSCETVLDNVPVPEIPVKAVVFGSIEVTGEYHALRVTKSKPIINNTESSSYDVITDAQVTVTSGTNSYTFIYSNDSKKYEYYGPLDLSSGEAQLKVITPTLGTLTSQVKVPDPIGTFEQKVDSIVRDYEVEYNIIFTLPPSPSAAYYRLEGYTGYATDTFPAYASKEYFTNEGSINDEQKLKTTIYKWKDSQGGSDDLYVNITRITQDYYVYGVALKAYQPNNPFAEPTPLPNNIEGGLGIFALTRTIRVKI
jgi:hypothetical protein